MTLGVAGRNGAVLVGDEAGSPGTVSPSALAVSGRVAVSLRGAPWSSPARRTALREAPYAAHMSREGGSECVVY
jgi:hypothetical protein